MYINGNEFSYVKSPVLMGNVPIAPLSWDFKIKENKTQIWANSTKASSIVYGKEEIQSINIELTQSQAQAIRAASPTGLLTGVSPQKVSFVCTDGGAKVFVWSLDDFEFLEDGSDTSNADEPAMKVKVACIASSIKNKRTV